MVVISLLSLPAIALQEIFSYLTFDELSRLRTVNHDFNDIGKELLNKGLLRIEKFHLTCLKDVKRQLPRRESERRSHPLARHVDVLMAIETRISMLSMTYSKYIDTGVACFIPGKVLDEIFRVLRIVKSSECPPRPHEILQELRDISSMAMEHFDDKIVPRLKQKMAPNNSPTALLLLKQATARRQSYFMKTPDTTPSAGPRHKSLDMKQKSQLTQISGPYLAKEVRSLKLKVRHQGRHIAYQRNKIIENSAKMSEMCTQIAELRRLVEERGPKGSMQTSSCEQLQRNIRCAKKRLAAKRERSKKKKRKLTCDTSK